MIKKIIKFLLIIFLILATVIFYLSLFGLKTNKFNNQINSNILKINKKINLDLKDVNYLLNPFDFTVNIKTKNPQILLEGKSLQIKDIQTNVSLKSLINNQFLIDDLQISTRDIKLNDIILLARKLHNSPQLYVLDTIIKDGLINANINLNFNKSGKIKENYKIEGYVKKAELNILNQTKLQNLYFNFNINKKFYSFKKVSTEFNNIKITSPLIGIDKKKNSFFVNGQFLSEKKNFNAKEFKPFFSNLLNTVDLQKLTFSSKNNFSFNINKKFKFKDFKVETTVDLNQLIINEKRFKLKKYFPNFSEKIKLEKHKIIINYDKNKFDIKGNGYILLKEKSDELSYQISKKKDGFLFDLKLNLKNNSLLIDFLDFKKEEGLNSLISIKGNHKKNDQIIFDLINLKAGKNEFLIKRLDLNKNFKIIDIENLNINYQNDKKIFNILNLKKDNLNFILEGESFDASKMIDNIMNSDDDNGFIFDNLNSKIDIKIKNTYIDEINYMNNLNGNIIFNNNKISNLKLESIFPNKKKIKLTIETTNDAEIITKLFSDYPAPLVKRYDFIKGFDEGHLDFYSSKKDGISNSVIVIDDFKIKEVPIFAKLLSLSSLQGMADLLTGEGIRFTDFEMNFSNQKGLTTIEEMYAIGPAVSILMDGYIESKKLVSLRGTLVPATTINRSISSIPLLGKILIGDKTGEGVFGVSFKIKGPPNDLKTSVNPIKTLTPRFITRTLEKIKKN